MAPAGASAAESKSLWNYTEAPGWKTIELVILRLWIMKRGWGNWSSLLKEGLLPGKTNSQLVLQSQRLVGQQSTADPLEVQRENRLKEGFERKNNLIINTEDKPGILAEAIDALRKINSEKYSLKQDVIDSLPDPSTVARKYFSLNQKEAPVSPLRDEKGSFNHLTQAQKKIRLEVLNYLLDQIDDELHYKATGQRIDVDRPAIVECPIVNPLPSLALASLMAPPLTMASPETSFIPSPVSIPSPPLSIPSPSSSVLSKEAVESIPTSSPPSSITFKQSPLSSQSSSSFKPSPTTLPLSLKETPQAGPVSSQSSLAPSPTTKQLLPEPSEEETPSEDLPENTPISLDTILPESQHPILERENKNPSPISPSSRIPQIMMSSPKAFSTSPHPAPPLNSPVFSSTLPPPPPINMSSFLSQDGFQLGSLQPEMFSNEISTSVPNLPPMSPFVDSIFNSSLSNTHDISPLQPNIPSLFPDIPNIIPNMDDAFDNSAQLIDKNRPLHPALHITPLRASPIVPDMVAPKKTHSNLPTPGPKRSKPFPPIASSHSRSTSEPFPSLPPTPPRTSARLQAKSKPSAPPSLPSMSPVPFIPSTPSVTSESSQIPSAVISPSVPPFPSSPSEVAPRTAEELSHEARSSIDEESPVPSLQEDVLTPEQDKPNNSEPAAAFDATPIPSQSSQESVFADEECFPYFNEKTGSIEYATPAAIAAMMQSPYDDYGNGNESDPYDYGEEYIDDDYVAKPKKVKKAKAPKVPKPPKIPKAPKAPKPPKVPKVKTPKTPKAPKTPKKVPSPQKPTVKPDEPQIQLNPGVTDNSFFSEIESMISAAKGG